METKLLWILLFVPVVSQSQIEYDFFKSLLKDQRCTYIDSTIIFITDTNQYTKAFQQQGVWRRRSVKDKSLLEDITTYFNGQLHGHSIVFYPNGRIATSSYNSYGLPHGPFTSFYENGHPAAVKFFENGIANGVFRDFDTSGRLVQIKRVCMNQKVGPLISFYASGNIHFITNYSADEENGIRREYSDDYKQSLKAEYGMKNGIRISGKFYQDGKLIKAQQYDYDKDLDEKQKKEKQEISDNYNK
ncbi:MAG: hypothetical protein SFU87_07935 [Chitinophagaceae bacterium]|nr:hypothetical protein [Chitinophagaceae bacterium]